jgi:hypothetical protein
MAPWSQWLALFQGMGTYSDDARTSGTSDWQIIQMFLPQLAGVPALCLPVLLVLVLAKQSSKYRSSRAGAFVRSYAAATLPAATVLLLFYSVVAVGTLCLEADLRTRADRFAASETGYLTQITDQPLPGFSPGHDLKRSQNTERTTRS